MNKCKPSEIPVQNIPKSLRERDQWVVWKRQDLDKGKTTKIPYDAKTGGKADSTDPATYSSFNRVVEVYTTGGYDGIGFVFTADDPFCGIDLDDCICEDGSLAPWAEEIVRQFNSYVEISPSERGLKIYFVGRKPDFARCAVKNVDPAGRPGELEVYDKGRYFCMTGNIYPGSTPEIRDCQDALDNLCKKYWRKPAACPSVAPQSATTIPEDDRVGRCFGAMMQLNMADKSDGSSRLYAACCRVVEHDLSDSQAMACIRAYAAIRPFPGEWSDAEIIKRIRDAEKQTNRGKTSQDEKPAQAEAIVRLALEKYRLGLTDAGEPFAVARNGPNLARVFRGGRDAMRAALARDYRRACQRTANASSLADALTTLEGECSDATPETVSLRVAAYGDSVAIDLGDVSGQAVIVRPGGWEVVSSSPVLFRHTALTGALPIPERGGRLEDLRRLLNLSHETWPLVRGWLVAALLPSIPHPILLLGGEQGTGKSTAARMLVNLIDPSPSPLRAEPRDAEGWALAAAGSWVVAVDNVSRISGWWSDVLCRAVSGDSWIRRRLYSDSDLSVLSFRRVVILTSIDAGAMRGDLGDRLLMADLSRIEESDRKTEAELDRDYNEMRPRVLGGLLDLLASVLLRLPQTKVPGLPRMADFAGVLAALDDADGADGCSLRLYLAQAGRIAGEVLESDPVAVSILALLDRTSGQWEGTTADLLQAIRPADKIPHSWPETARTLAGRLRRLTPALRAAKIEIERDRTGHDRTRRLTIRKVPESTVRNVRNDAEGKNPDFLCGQSADDADEGGRSIEAERPQEPADQADEAHHADDADDTKHPFSGLYMVALDPDQPGPTDRLSPEQAKRYKAIYYSRPTDMSPSERHKVAWRAVLKNIS